VRRVLTPTRHPAARLAHWAVLALLLPAALSCDHAAPPTPPPPQVAVRQPVRREVVEWDEYTGRLEAIDSVEVRPRVGGYLQSVLFQEGAMIDKGSVLFQIDPRPYQATLRHAEADLRLAETRLQLARKNSARADSLLATHAISQEDADIRESNVRQAEASVAEAQAVVDAAKLDVEFTRITAPVSGRVGRRLVTEGNLVNGGSGTQGTLLTTIVSLNPIYAYFEADERSYLKYVRLAESGLRPSSRDYKNPVEIGLADEEGFPHQGYMDFVDNQLDRGTGTIVGRAIVDNPDLLLAPGLFVRLRVPGSSLHQALLLPDEAVGTDQSQRYVWVVDADDRAHYRRVETGPLIDGLRVIRDGVSADDWVVVAGTQRVRPDLIVQPMRQTPDGQTPGPKAPGGQDTAAATP
jgi:RND family efflux transporter MFP subunit